MNKPRLVLELEQAQRDKTLGGKAKLEEFGLTQGNARKSLRAHREAASVERTSVEDMPVKAWGTAVDLLQTLGVAKPEKILGKAIHTSKTAEDFWFYLEQQFEEKDFDYLHLELLDGLRKELKGN